jgi:hypothetical protein
MSMVAVGAEVALPLVAPGARLGANAEVSKVEISLGDQSRVIESGSSLLSVEC